MRSLFPGYFRPTPGEFESLWANALFAVDANVLLNLYRYSEGTRQELEKALASVQNRLFLPNQAAAEFLRNRAKVTADQAEEYTKATRTLRSLSETLSNRKRHPFLVDDAQSNFSELMKQMCNHLDSQQAALLERLTSDEILGFLDASFEGRTGHPYGREALQGIFDDGQVRFSQKVPPGYRDANKGDETDSLQRYGDLVVWKQLIDKARESKHPLIFVTDDKKEDWWLMQAGRTIGPRPELVEEFIRETQCHFWMYSVDRFVEEAAKRANAEVNQEVIDEIVEVRADNAAQEADKEIQKSKKTHLVMEKQRLLAELAEFLESHPSGDGGVGLRYFVVQYLGSQDYEINHSYAFLNELANEGKVVIFKADRDGTEVTRVRLAD